MERRASRINASLLIGLAVHDIEAKIVLVEVGEISTIDSRFREVLTRSERAIDDRPRPGVLQFHPHERLALPWLDVLVFRHREQALRQIERRPRSDVIC